MTTFHGFEKVVHVHKNEQHLADDELVEFLQLIIPVGNEKVFTTVYGPTVTPKADIIVMHGMDAFGAYFAKYAGNNFTTNGFRVTVPDLPSHGRTSVLFNPNTHGLYDDVSIFPKVVDTLLNELLPKYTPSLSGKVFVIGKSLGGMHLVNYFSQYQHKNQVDGAIFICPAVELSSASKPSFLLEQTVRTLLYFAPWMGNLEAPSNGVHGNICADPQFEIDFYAEPLNYRGRVKMGSGIALMDSMMSMKEKIPGIRIPFLIIHGEEDKATALSGSRALYENAASKDKNLITYPGIQHIIFHEKPDAVNDLTDWMLNRC
jgi:acylglycerol lipase